MDEKAFADYLSKQKDGTRKMYSGVAGNILKDYIKARGLRQAGLGGLAGLAAGGLSRMYDGDRKRGALVGGLAGLATASPDLIKELKGMSEFDKIESGLEKELIERGIPKTRASILAKVMKRPISTKLKMYAAIVGTPLAIGGASGALSGALLGKKKKRGLLERIKDMMGMG